MCVLSHQIITHSSVLNESGSGISKAGVSCCLGRLYLQIFRFIHVTLNSIIPSSIISYEHSVSLLFCTYTRMRTHTHTHTHTYRHTHTHTHAHTHTYTCTHARTYTCTHAHTHTHTHTLHVRVSD